jgi:hypothetical protein
MEKLSWTATELRRALLVQCAAAALSCVGLPQRAWKEKVRVGNIPVRMTPMIHPGLDIPLLKETA